MQLKKYVIALSLSLMGISSVYASNLLVNGDFENVSTFVNNGQDAMAFGPGSTALVGWNVVNSAGLDTAWVGSGNPFGMVPSHGNYLLDLTGYHDRAPYSGVTQSFATTIGQTYTVSFDLGHYFGGSASAIQASAGNYSHVFEGGTSNTNEWDHETFTFKANSTSTTLSLLGETASNGTFIGLDNVSVAAVPEPQTYAMLLAGLGLLTLMRRKSKAAR